MLSKLSQLTDGTSTQTSPIPPHIYNFVQRQKQKDKLTLETKIKFWKAIPHHISHSPHYPRGKRKCKNPRYARPTDISKSKRELFPQMEDAKYHAGAAFDAAVDGACHTWQTVEPDVSSFVQECLAEPQKYYEHKESGMAIEAAYEKQTMNSIVSITESTGLLVHALTRAETNMDFFLAFVTFYKAIIPGSVILSLTSSFGIRFQKLFNQFSFSSPVARRTGLVPQSKKGFRSFAKQARELFTNFEKVKESDLMRKMTKMYMYILGSGLAEKFGYNFTDDGYEKLTKINYNVKSPTFYMHLIDTTIFLFERGIQAFDTGCFANFFHASDSYAQFYADFTTIKEQSFHLSNPKVINLDIKNFLKKCADTITTGKIIVERLAWTKEKYGALAINRMVHEMIGIKTKYILNVASRKARNVPFSILLYGPPGIGKSSVTRDMFAVAAKQYGYANEDDRIYVRSSGEKHWNGFTSSMWGLLLDDIAYIRGDKSAGIDESIKDLLQIINSVAFMPEQAAIEDKGTTPFLCDIVIGTTNIKDLNARLYFCTDAAVRRRFPFIVTLTDRKSVV